MKSVGYVARILLCEQCTFGDKSLLQFRRHIETFRWQLGLSFRMIWDNSSE